MHNTRERSAPVPHASLPEDQASALQPPEASHGPQGQPLVWDDHVTQGWFGRLRQWMIRALEASEGNG